MGISWSSPEPSLPLEEVIRLLEEEMKAWKQAADEVVALKPNLHDTEALNRADRHIYWCRARAEALRKLVTRICDTGI